MAGTFELFTEMGGRLRIRLVAADGTVLALSEAFDHVKEALNVVEAFREIAGTGLIVDRRAESMAPRPIPPKKVPEVSRQLQQLPFRRHATVRIHCDAPSGVRVPT
ncbi:YegP family protein [bacterium RCC_150]